MWSEWKERKGKREKLGKMNRKVKINWGEQVLDSHHEFFQGFTLTNLELFGCSKKDKLMCMNPKFGFPHEKKLQKNFFTC